MARTKTAPRRKPAAANIGRMLILDAVRNWVVFTVVGVSLALLWVLYNVEVIDPGVTVTVAGALFLFGALFAALRRFLHERTSVATAVLAGGFAVLWFAATYIPFYQLVNPGTPLLTAELKAKGAPATVPLGGTMGSFRVLVEGHFLPSETRANREAHYRLSIGHGTTTDQLVEGDFNDHWSQQRLGRRGVAPVHVVHVVAQHTIESPTGEDITLALDEVSAGIRDTVTVQVYRSRFPTLVFAAVGAALTVGALFVDGLRGDPTDGLVTITTLAAVLSIAAFRRFASPHPGFGDLLVNTAIGTLVGGLAGSVLWRLVGSRLPKRG